jgi:uncharacterized protein YjeT (DUF2065 family)
MIELSFWSALTLGFAMMLIIEGLIYGLFPNLIKELLSMLENVSPSQITFWGLTSALSGALIISFILSQGA